MAEINSAETSNVHATQSRRSNSTNGTAWRAPKHGGYRPSDAQREPERAPSGRWHLEYHIQRPNYMRWTVVHHDHFGLRPYSAKQDSRGTRPTSTKPIVEPSRPPVGGFGTSNTSPPQK